MLIKKFLLLIFILISNVHAADDYDFDAAIAASLKQQAEVQALQRARDFPLFKYVQTMVDTNDFPLIERLFVKPNYQEWQLAYKKIGHKEPVNGLSVALLLDELKQVCPKGSDVEALADQALLQLFSGCWGISDERISPDVERRLKNILYGVGHTSAERDRHRDGFGEKVFETFDANKVLESAPRYNEHFFTVFLCLSEGYGKAQPDVLRPLIEIGGALFMSMEDIVGQAAAQFFTKAGYHPAGSPVNLEGLVETARFRDPQFRVTAPQIGQLKKYLADFDPDSAKIGANLENLKLFWHVLMDQPAVNTSTPEALADLLFRGILPDFDDRESFLSLLGESLKFTDFKGNPDAAYDKALDFKNVKDKKPKGDNFQTISDGVYNWLMQYINTINDDNKVKRDAFLVNYTGSSYFNSRLRLVGESRNLAMELFELSERQQPDHSHGRRNAAEDAAEERAQERVKECLERLEELGMMEVLNEDAEITKEQFDWLSQRVLLPLAKVKAGLVDTGAIKVPLYSINRDDSFANRGRAIDYLVAKKRVDPSLKLPILLMLRTGMLD